MWAEYENKLLGIHLLNTRPSFPNLTAFLFPPHALDHFYK